MPQSIVIEVSDKDVIVDGDIVSDLSSFFSAKENCPESIVIMVDKNVEHKNVVAVMDVVKRANCAKISIASI